MDVGRNGGGVREMLFDENLIIFRAKERCLVNSS